MGVVSDDGRLITFNSQHGGFFTMEWVYETEADSIITAILNEKDPSEAPSNNNTLRPGPFRFFLLDFRCFRFWQVNHSQKNDGEGRICML